MKDCIFCKIAKGEIPSEIVHEDESVVAFRDINPKAPVHVLVIPREHLEAVADTGDIDILGKVLKAASIVAEKEGIRSTGFRMVINQGRDAGQEVPHLHLHLLGGRSLSWPPG